MYINKNINRLFILINHLVELLFDDLDLTFTISRTYKIFYA